MFLISTLSCTTTGISLRTSCSTSPLLSVAMMACMICARSATLVALTSFIVVSLSQSMAVAGMDKVRDGENEVSLLL
jgi:hypothetical protein